MPECCPLCKGHCTNGAECAISQFLGTPINWTQDRPEVREYRATLIPDLDPVRIAEARTTAPAGKETGDDAR